MFSKKIVILIFILFSILAVLAVVFLNDEYSASARRAAFEADRTRYMSDILRITDGVAPVLWIEPKYSYENNGKYFDLSGNANHATQSTADYQPAVNPPGLKFDGNDYLDLSSSIGNFSSLSAGSIEAWFNTSASSPTLSTIISLSDSGDSSSEFAIRVPDGATNKLRVVVRENGVMLIDVSSDDFFNGGNWHHLVYSVSSSGNTIYIDGVAIPVTYSTGTSSSHIFFSDVNDLDFMSIGANKDLDFGLQWFFNGSIDSVRIYDIALTPAQIQNLYLAGLPGHR